jgi:hypothetical protein
MRKEKITLKVNAKISWKATSWKNKTDIETHFNPSKPKLV